MPELAELKITADYINEMCEGLTFQRIEKNPQHKGEKIEVPFHKFTVSAKSRGKELMLTLSDCFSRGNSTTLLMTMGMSGYFKLVPLNEIPKHAHLIFYAHGSVALCFVDVRRFGKWKKTPNWSDNRGPDPTADYESFFKNIDRHILSKEFKKPIHEVMMNQKYFNGIGNYLRAEILYRADVNPFLSTKDAIEQGPEILELCRRIPLEAYKLGGGSIKDWENPYNIQPQNWDEFMLCYGNPAMDNIVDRNGRRFWFNPKWSKNHERVS